MILAAPAMNAHNTFDSPDLVHPVKFDGFHAAESGSLTVELPAMSVVRLSLKG